MYWDILFASIMDNTSKKHSQLFTRYLYILLFPFLYQIIHSLILIPHKLNNTNRFDKQGPLWRISINHTIIHNQSLFRKCQFFLHIFLELVDILWEIIFREMCQMQKTFAERRCWKCSAAMFNSLWNITTLPSSMQALMKNMFSYFFLDFDHFSTV